MTDSNKQPAVENISDAVSSLDEYRKKRKQQLLQQVQEVEHLQVNVDDRVVEAIVNNAVRETEV